MTLLQLVQTALAELGMPQQPVTVAGATDPTVRQMLALANAVGRDAVDRANWSILATDLVLTIPEALTTTGDLVDGSAVVTNIPNTTAIAAGTFLCSGDGLTVPARVVSVDSTTQVTLEAPANATGASVDLTFGQDTFAVPADFKCLTFGTMYDRTNRWRVLGPTSPQADEWRRVAVNGQSVFKRYRQRGRPANVLRIWPPPYGGDSGATISTEYASRYWATNASGTAIAQFAADTDTCVFTDRTMLAGLKAAWRGAKGFTAGMWEADPAYLSALNAAIVEDRGGPGIIGMSRQTRFANTLNTVLGDAAGATGDFWLDDFGNPVGDDYGDPISIS